MLRRQPRSTLFPYTTLFRSVVIRLRPPPLHRRVREHDLAQLAVGRHLLDELAGMIEPVLADDRQHLDRKSTRLNSSHTVISYAVFCLKKKKNTKHTKR